MDATHIATAGVQPGDTSKVRMFADRITKLRHLRMLDRLIADLERLDDAGMSATALGLHRQARERLARELGL